MEKNMKLKDALGLIFIGVGATVATVGYRILGLQWYFAACVPLAIGVFLIWSANRDRKIREALDEVPGDWGDRHYSSGSHATDDFDTGADGGHD
jgi:purine-cytosine permease-like protein